MLPKLLVCDAAIGCGHPITHIDEKGYIYCTEHGVRRRVDQGRRCRKLRPYELNRLNRGEAVERY